MTFRTLLHAGVVTLLLPAWAAAQTPCAKPLASLRVPRLGYAAVSGPFEQRLYVYAPDIRSTGGNRFQPFQLWVVEGVYGKPFLQSSGILDEQAFKKLLSSPNVRATAISVARGDGSDRGRFSFARNAYTVEIANVAASGNPAVGVRICR